MSDALERSSSAGKRRRPVPVPHRIASAARRGAWALLSVGLFAGVWEFAWLAGLADPRLLPPHLFLGDAVAHARRFDTAARLRIGSDPDAALAPTAAVLVTVGSTVGRVLAGVVLAAAAALAVGMAVRYWRLMGRLSLPTMTLLASVSPVAWLPVAIFTLGVGDASAVFMVFVTLFFIMTLATISQIDAVDGARIETAVMLGATRAQVFPALGSKRAKWTIHLTRYGLGSSALSRTRETSTTRSVGVTFLPLS